MAKKTAVVERCEIVEALDEIPKDKIRKEGDVWVMEDVVLLSEFSKNKMPDGKCRRYPVATMEAALDKFDGIQVNANHPKIVKDPSSPTGISVDSVNRSVLETLGQAVSPRVAKFREGRRTVHKVLARVEMPCGPAADHIVGLARLNSRLAGMSITGDGGIRESDDEGYVDMVDLDPRSVDVVHRPGTTVGFFESLHAEAEGPAVLADCSTEEAFKRAQKAKDLARESAGKAGKSKKPEEYTAAAMRYREAARLLSCAARKKLEDGEVDAAVSLEKEAADSDRLAWSFDSLARQQVEKEAHAEVDAEVDRIVEAMDFDDEDDDDDEDEDEDEDEDDLGDDEDEEDEGDDEDDEDDEDSDADDDLGDDDLGDDEDDEEDGEDLDLGEDDGEEGDEGELGEQAPAKSPTQEANEVTEEANQAMTSASHLKARFAHMKAAGLVAEKGDFAKAEAHADAASRHFARAMQLKASEKPEQMAPTPDAAQGEQPSPEQVRESLAYHSTLSEFRRGMDASQDWVRDLYGIGS